ncbi:MAG: hypothetical protein LBO63_07430 [Oscillospiraceae bacterium]|jgi:hypothetical protein|nr:hypothetical protein [Oscillospiraceae bacterium]
MKKIIYSALLCMLCIALLTACGKTEDGTAKPTENSPAEVQNGEAQIFVGPMYFETIEEFLDLVQKVNSENFESDGTYFDWQYDELRGLEGYFTAGSINDGFTFVGINVGGYTQLLWSAAGGLVDFERLNMQPGKLDSYIQSAGTPELYEQKEGYYIYIGDANELQLEWEEQGHVFRAHVPRTWTWEQVKAFCTAQWVPVTQAN